MHERRRSISQAKGHDLELKMAIPGPKGRLLLIPFGYSDLMVAAPQVDFLEDPCPQQTIKQLVYPR